MVMGRIGRLAVTGLLAGVLMYLPSGSPDAEAAGAAVFKKNKCGSCHQIKGPATEKTFADQLKKKGPELWYAGSKLNKDWMESWLAKPTIIRALKFNSAKELNPGKHPALAKKDAAEVAAYLSTLKSANVKEGVVKPKAGPRARLNFTKKFSCIGCHSIKTRGKLVGGVSGPDLSEAGKRLKGDWVFAYLMEPKVFKPVKRMPIFVGIIGEAEMRTLAGYVVAQGRKKK